MLSNSYLQIIGSRSKSHVHLIIATALIFTFIIFESRETLYQIYSYALNAQPVFDNVFVIQSMGNELRLLRLSLTLAILDIFDLPLSAAMPILLISYRILAGVAMFFFLFRYQEVAFGFSNKIPGTTFAAIGSLIFVHYPYNVLGDNFPEGVIMRSLAPIYFLSLLEFFERRKIFLFASSLSIFAYSILMDPRALIYVGIPSVAFIVAPKLLLKSSLASKIFVASSFSVGFLIAFTLSSYSVFPRFGQDDAVATSVHIPLVKDAFRYQSASFTNAIKGLGFEGTQIEYTQALSPLSEQYFLLHMVGLSLLSVLSFVLLPIIFPTRRQYLAYILPILILAFITIALFVRFADEPIIMQLLFSDKLAERSSTDNLSKFLTSFRVPRFLDYVLSNSYAILIASMLALTYNRSENLFYGSHSRIRRFYDKAHYITRRWMRYALPIISGFCVVSISWVFILNGTLYSLDDERSKGYDMIGNRFRDDAGYRKIVSVPYDDTRVHYSFPQPPVGNGHSVLHHFYEYTLDPSKLNSLLSRGQVEDLANMLRWSGMKHIVIDEYNTDFSSIRRTLEDSTSFSLSYKIGKLYVYSLKDSKDATIASGSVFVVGGYETFRLAANSINRSDSLAPIFLDSPLPPTMLEQPMPIISTPNKSQLDILLSFLVNDEESIIVTPVGSPKDYNPSLVWSPADITDSHHSVWSWAFPQRSGYQWEYSYRPEYGFVFTSGHDVLSTAFSVVKEDDYRVYARILMKNEERSSIIFTVDDNAPRQVSGTWENNSVEFIWVDLGGYHLTPGKHTIKILNEEGSNAVNLILLSPESRTKSHELVNSFIKQNGLILPQYDSISGDGNSINLKALINGNYTLIFRIAPEGESDLILKIGEKIYKPETVSANPLILQFNNVSLHSGSNPANMMVSDEYRESRRYMQLARNPSFEEVVDSGITGWSAPGNGYGWQLDPSSKINGLYSLKVTTNSANEQWSWILSEEISVVPGGIYEIKTNMRWDNVVASHIAIDYVSKVDGLTRRLMSLPSAVDGSSDWQQFETRIMMPEDATALRIALNAGWVKDFKNGNASTWFDDIEVKHVFTPIPIQYVTLYGPQNSLASNYIEAGVWNYSSGYGKLSSINVHSPDRDYNEYHISLSTTNRTILVIPELYTGTHRISSDHESIDYTTFPVYSIFTGILIESPQGKDLDITIFKDDSRLFLQYSHTTLLTIAATLLLSVVIDIVLMYSAFGRGLRTLVLSIVYKAKRN